LLKNGIKLQLMHGNITWKPPIAYQMKDGKKITVGLVLSYRATCQLLLEIMILIMSW
jgi:hypothetical protein